MVITSLFINTKHVQTSIYIIVKQTVQKEQEFKYQIDQLRKANRTLFLQMASLSDDDLEDDDEQISNTPEGDCDDTFSCKSSITSSPTLSDLPILMTTGNCKYIIMNHVYSFFYRFSK